MTGGPSGAAAPSALCLIWTKAMRIWARASRSVATSGPNRSPSPSTRQAKASMARAAAARSGGAAERWMAAELVQPHGVVDDDDLGRHLRHPGRGPRRSGPAAPPRRRPPRPPEVVLGVVAGRPGRERPPPEPSGSRGHRRGARHQVSRGCSRPLTYPGQLNSKRGPAGLAGASPHPATRRSTSITSIHSAHEGVRRVDARGAPAVADLSDRRTTATGGATSAWCSASASSFPGRSSPLRRSDRP